MKLIFELIEPKQNLYMAKGKSEGFAVSKKEISAEVNIRNNKRKQNTHIMRGFRVWVKNQPTTTKHTAHNTKKKQNPTTHNDEMTEDLRRGPKHTTHTHNRKFASVRQALYPMTFRLYVSYIHTPTHPYIYLVRIMLRSLIPPKCHLSNWRIEVKVTITIF